jgi:hypothetical protein
VFQQGCFSGTWTADQIEGDCAYFIEMFPIGSGQGVVCGKQTGMNVHRFTVAMTMRPGVVVIVVVVMVVIMV